MRAVGDGGEVGEVGLEAAHASVGEGWLEIGMVGEISIAETGMDTHSTNSLPVVALGFSVVPWGFSPSVVLASFLTSACSCCNRITSIRSSRLMSRSRLTRSFSRFSEPGVKGVDTVIFTLEGPELGGKFGVCGVCWPCGCWFCPWLWLWF